MYGKSLLEITSIDFNTNVNNEPSLSSRWDLAFMVLPRIQPG